MEGFSAIGSHLKALMNKKVKFDWSKKSEKRLQVLKDQLNLFLVLALPNYGKRYMVYCNASRVGLGCVLMQGIKVIHILRGS